ncbi:MAG: hypothetical protein AAGA75_20730 [Cyanobacteria bacterium P01_E01_bin.6]
MAHYIAQTLPQVYEIISAIDGPKAIIDFISGELGNEVLISQSLGGKFYDHHHQRMRVIALTWQGCDILYRNISHEQIELINDEITPEWNKNRYTTGENRFNWLMRQHHGRKLMELPDIRARLGPLWCSCGLTLGGYSGRRNYFAKLGFEKQYSRYWYLAINRLGRTQPIFDAGARLVAEPYISIFDRHDRHNPKRNTQPWHLDLFKQWADELSIKLVVISDFYPRSLPADMIRFQSPHRDMTMIANIVTHSLLHAAPASGAAELALVFGCHFVQLCDCSVAGFDLYNPLMFAPMSRGRGYQHFGVFNPKRQWFRRLGSVDPHNETLKANCFDHIKTCLGECFTHVPTP